MNDETTTGASLFKEATSTVGSVASDIKIAAGQKFDQALTEVRSKADDAKSGVADDVKDVANALRRASEELRSGSAQERTLGTIASSLADASDSLRNKDLGEIVQMISKVARDNPVLFLGGAALLGFAASRYAKATGGQPVMAKDEKAAYKSQIDTFRHEGNPNVHPAHAPL